MKSPSVLDAVCVLSIVLSAHAWLTLPDGSPERTGEGGSGMREHGVTLRLRPGASLAEGEMLCPDELNMSRRAESSQNRLISALFDRSWPWFPFDKAYGKVV